MPGKRKQPEQALQITCVEWLALLEAQGRLMYAHVPNGGARSASEGSRLKKMGVRPGFPDLILIFPGGRSAYVEMKAGTGKLSPDQGHWYDSLVFHGHSYYVCRSLEEMQQIVAGMEALKSEQVKQIPFIGKVS